MTIEKDSKPKFRPDAEEAAKLVESLKRDVIELVEMSGPAAAISGRVLDVKPVAGSESSPQDLSRFIEKK